MNTSGSDNSGLGDNLARFTKELPTLVFAEYRDRATISGQNSETAIAEVSVSRIRPRITPPMLQQIASLPPARIVKILEVREQIAQGKYNLDERLDAVLGPLLVDINA